MLTTLNTPFGRYRFLRMPFEIHSAQDVFQKMVDKTYGDLQAVTAIIDDILLYGTTKEEHDNKLRAVLQRSRERGVTLNPDKLIYRTEAVSFFGNLITSEGVKPDPSKISAIMDMPSPENKAELQTLLGMVNYLAKFSPRVSETMAPLRELLKKNTPFQWGAQQEKAFSEVKQACSYKLRDFDPQKKVELSMYRRMVWVRQCFKMINPLLSLPSR